MRAWMGLVALTGALAAGCHGSRTEVVVVVSTAPGVEVGRDFEFLHLTVNDRDANELEFDSNQVFVCPFSSGTSGSCLDLPVTLTLVPGKNRPDDHVRVQVEAGKRNLPNPVTTDAAVFRFVEGQSSVLEFVIYPLCLNKDCASRDQACDATGMCVDIFPKPVQGELDFAVPADFSMPMDLARTDLIGADFSVPADFATPSDMTCIPNCAGQQCGLSPNCPGVFCPNMCQGGQSCSGTSCVGCTSGAGCPGTVCCTGTFCSAANVCSACGAQSQSCCPPGPPSQPACNNTFLSCSGMLGNTCQPCGLNGQICCTMSQPCRQAGTECDNSGTFPEPTCTPCGNFNQICCFSSFPQCNGPLQCDGFSGTCQQPPDMAQPPDGPCGNQNDPCCAPDSSCNSPDLECNGGTCECGLLGLPCCGGSICTDGSSCNPGAPPRCGPRTIDDGGLPPLCGGPLQMCCTGGPPCMPGSSCCMTTMCFDAPSSTFVSAGVCFRP